MKVCMCGAIIPTTAVIEGKRRNLKNRTQCLTCLPFNSSIYRKKATPEEKRAKAAKKIQRWYHANKQKNGGTDPIKLLRDGRKAMILGLVGSKCQICPYDRCKRNLTFHHLNDKEFRVDSRFFQSGFETVIRELSKCMVACHNCHGEIHEGLIAPHVIQTAHDIFVDKLASLTPECWRWKSFYGKMRT